MEKLAFKYDIFLRAQAAFKRSLSFYKKNNMNHDQEIKEAAVATFTKHFNWYHESLWKYLQAYFKEKSGKDFSGSKEVFRFCYKQGFISEPELEHLIETVKIRNTIIHDYGEENIEPILQAIIQCFPAMLKLAETAIKLQKP